MTLAPGGDPRRVRLAVPAFVSPAEDPWFWQRLAGAADLAHFVVVDPGHGQGDPADRGYEEVMALLRTAGMPMVGYIDTAYGLTSAREVAARTRDWVGRHGVHAVYLDRFGSAPEDFDDFASVVLAARCAGAQAVVINPGRTPAPAYLSLAEVTVTFQGSWQDYVAYRPDASLVAWPASRLCHLVHGVPPEYLGAAPEMAAARHAETVFFSDESGHRPWRRLPDALLRSVAAWSAPHMPPASGRLAG
ncbi:MAG: spherulation-specific family 4 protein [Kineosporiaceae bacterium]